MRAGASQVARGKKGEGGAWEMNPDALEVDTSSPLGAGAFGEGASPNRFFGPALPRGSFVVALLCRRSCAATTTRGRLCAGGRRVGPRSAVVLHTNSLCRVHSAPTARTAPGSLIIGKKPRCWWWL